MKSVPTLEQMLTLGLAKEATIGPPLDGRTRDLAEEPHLKSGIFFVHQFGTPDVPRGQTDDEEAYIAFSFAPFVSHWVDVSSVYHLDRYARAFLQVEAGHPVSLVMGEAEEAPYLNEEGIPQRPTEEEVLEFLDSPIPFPFPDPDPDPEP